MSGWSGRDDADIERLICVAPLPRTNAASHVGSWIRMTVATAPTPRRSISAASIHTPPPSHARPAVLCVDDELHVLDGVERVLRNHFNVTKVTNAADAIVAFQYGGPFAVIVCDFRLAETDG